MELQQVLQEIRMEYMICLEVLGKSHLYLTVVTNTGCFSSSGWETATGLTVDSSSTKYATKYNNSSYDRTGDVIYTVGKVGDATKETYIGSGSTNWFLDESSIAFLYNPFLSRGYYYGGGASAGVFYSWCNTGGGDSYNSFRCVLCP